MIELTIKLTAPASAGGGEGATTHTVERSMKMDRTATNEDELERMVKSFALAAERELEELIAEAYADFRKKAAAPPSKAKKGNRPDATAD